MKSFLKSNKADAFKLNRALLKRGSCFVFKNDPDGRNNLKQLDEVEQVVKESKSKKKKVKNLVMFLINLVVVGCVLFYQIKQEGVISLGQLFEYNLNGWYFLMAVGFLILLMVLKSLRFNILIKEATGRSRPTLSYKVSALGRYYDNITPMATGGQPFQVFYLNKRGLSASTAISIPLEKYFIGQFAFMTVSVFCVIYSMTHNLLGGSTVVKIVSLLSFVLNIVLVGGLILLSISKGVGRVLVAKTLKFLQKIKLVKNYDKQYNKIMGTVEDYQTSIKSFMKNKGMFFGLYILSIFILLIIYSFPFFVYCGMVEFDISLWLDMFVKTAMIEIAASLIPLPGGTGMNEFSFTAVFANLFLEGRMFWALIIYRLFSYYFYLIQGLFVIIYDYIIGDKRYEWQKKKWALQGESETFKQLQFEKMKKNKRPRK